ncbi:MAG: Bifunctional phosphoglucose/phosphomannose isomerase [Candidatus Collierbacteria bacterium GW2011_GWC2_44_18]|uniref:Bifunctional phosphoglucose/phosphomannose isomerase n=2 Tax=Microgenomates group TaxID=1794810 RepID=A0A0G1M568_9BACT|nr:MAG: Bifunctional phosphoglucose/phosphomannose isomerase [Microgenomates group bacterium GW2011_GWC1_44_10]KKT48805.1 MAG: Bifunctional phosphoglucose/phosphomannose isomerase [Candidatus Collierbacteria bacterium GW2011_GWC2_44_18]KKT67074.1 MAG: Bifunctional phosphoglucose/phosphomannose isomerase [Candidatus Woesebacteria bacterium GW2011_GWA2_44_33]
MNSLDNPKIFRLQDPDNMYDSLTKFGRQIESGWHQAEFVNLNFDPNKINNIVFAGMGGSNLSAEIVRSLAPFLLAIPFEMVANYRLPSYSDKKTLVILSSYSGNTEEIISCAQDASQRNCPEVCITANGKLKELAKNQQIPLIELDEKHNPSRSPRAGVCLSIGALIGLLLRLNPSAGKFFNRKDIIQTIERVTDLVNVQKNTQENPAKALALRHKGLGLIFFTANHLTGVGKLFSNFLNETAKTFCASFSFPDLNHHLLEGLSYPTSLKDNTSFLILNSDAFPEIIQRRIRITRDVLLKQKYRVTVIKPETVDPVLQVFESLVFLVMFSYYLGIVNKVNPAINPWVDYLKKELH